MNYLDVFNMTLILIFTCYFVWLKFGFCSKWVRKVSNKIHHHGLMLFILTMQIVFNCKMSFFYHLKSFRELLYLCALNYVLKCILSLLFSTSKTLRVIIRLHFSNLFQSSDSNGKFIPFHLHRFIKGSIFDIFWCFFRV